MDQQFSRSGVPDVLDLVPALRLYARALRNDGVSADGLVKHTLSAALEEADSYVPGSDLRTWLLTIMRRVFYTRLRIRSWKDTSKSDLASSRAASWTTPDPDQDGLPAMSLLRRLPPLYQEAIVLVMILGQSYEAAAEICDCPVGTIKSRMAWARVNMIEDICIH